MPIFRFHLLVLSALVVVGLANEDVFLKWAKEQGKQYKTKAELTMRQAIFMKNYNRMVEHNKDFDAGKVTWARGVNQWYDLTMEEWRAEMGIGRTEPCKFESYILTFLAEIDLIFCVTGMSGNMEEQNTTSSTPHPKPTGAAPSSWDWRSHGIVSPVKVVICNLLILFGLVKDTTKMFLSSRIRSTVEAAPPSPPLPSSSPALPNRPVRFINKLHHCTM